MTMTTLRVHGLDCADEATPLREALQPRLGVRELSFDLLRGLMIVEHDEAIITSDDLRAAVATIGLRAELNCGTCPIEGSTSEPSRGWRSVVTVASGVLLGIGFVVQGLTGGWPALLGTSESPPSMLVRVLFIASSVVGGSLVLPKAWLTLRGGRLDMNVLMT